LSTPLPIKSIKLKRAVVGGVACMADCCCRCTPNQMPSDKDDKDVSMLLIALLANDDEVDKPNNKYDNNNRRDDNIA